MKNRIIAAAFICAVVMLLSGCSSMFDKEYRSEEIYEDEYFEIKGDSSVQEVNNYRGMKTALMNLVNSAAEYGVIRTEKYNGDVADDISKACFEVTREEPMGIFAVDYITHSVNRIVSYYEIEVYVTYKRTAEEILGVFTVRSGIEMWELLSNQLKVYADSLVIMRVSTSIDENMIREHVKSIYRMDPISVPVCPEVEIHTYSEGENAIQEITEIQLSYGHSDEELANISSRLRGFVWKNVELRDYGDIDHICSVIMNNCQPAADGASSAYAALVEGTEADSEGYAMAVKLLCNAAGVDSHVVEGELDGEKYFWNIVNLRGKLYHLDMYSAALNESEPEFLLDDEMNGRYSWDKGKYPACENRDSILPEIVN